MKRLIYPTASVRVSSQNLIGIAEVSGVVTPDAVRLIVRDSPAWTKGDALAHLVMYDSAAMALSVDFLLGVAQAAKAALTDIPPAALVVAEDQLPMFQRYAAAMGQSGALIAAFTSREAASAWVVRQAEVRAHWRALRRGLQSGS